MQLALLLEMQSTEETLPKLFCSFLTGMSKAAWDLRIIDDGLMENTENLAVYIQQPVNAVLGRRRKMRIRLINAEDGI